MFDSETFQFNKVNGITLQRLKKRSINYALFVSWCFLVALKKNIAHGPLHGMRTSLSLFAHSTAN